jgi:hypothetical protein
MPRISFDPATLTVGTVLWFVNDTIIDNPKAGHDGIDLFISFGTITKIDFLDSTYDREGKMIWGRWHISFDNNPENFVSLYHGMNEINNPLCFLTEDEAVTFIEARYARDLAATQEELRATQKTLRYMTKRNEEPIVRIDVWTGARHGRYKDSLLKAVRDKK